MRHLIKTPLSEAHKSLPQNEQLEQDLTELEITSIEHDQSLTDLEIEVEELKNGTGTSTKEES